MASFRSCAWRRSTSRSTIRKPSSCITVGNFPTRSIPRSIIARVEPPSGLNYVSYKAAERRREAMFVFGCAGAMLGAVLFGAGAAGLFIAGLQWGLYLLAGIPPALGVGIGLMIPAVSHDGAAHWLPRPLRDFTLAILNFVRGR
jgi:predicted exporter